MLLLGLDFETTGLDVQTADVIEVGAVLWDTALGCPLKMLSTLVTSAAPVSEDIAFLTGITNQALEDWGTTPLAALFELSTLMLTPGLQAVVAHNGNAYDKPLLEHYAKRIGVDMPQLHWVDTMLDLPFPSTMKTRNLTHLAAEHGFLNPFAHRAVFDVLTMLKILGQYDAEKVLALSYQANVILEAQTEKPWIDGGKSTGEAKARGFHWNGEKKAWLKTVKEGQVEAEKAGASFGIRIFGNG